MALDIIFKHQKLIDLSAKHNFTHTSHHNSLLFLPNHIEENVWYELSSNQYAIHLLQKNLEEINFKQLSKNTSTKAIDILEKHLDLIDWSELSRNTNPKAIELLARNPDNINWSILSGNETKEAILLLRNNLDKVNWFSFSSNKHTDAIILLSENQANIDWHSITFNHNPDIIPILEQNLDLVDWKYLSLNPIAIPLFKKHKDNINWSFLTLNTDAYELLKDNMDEIDQYNITLNAVCFKKLYDDTYFNDLDSDSEDFKMAMINFVEQPEGLDILEKHFEEIQDIDYIKHHLSINPALLELDYQKMSIKRSRHIYLELIEKAFHPDRVGKWLDYHLEQGKPIETFDYI